MSRYFRTEHIAMITLYEKITEDIKSAMKSGDAVSRDCLRSLVSEIKNQSVNAGNELTDEIVQKCLAKSVKQHKYLIEQFKTAGREDLLHKEESELAVLSSYLPKMLTADETKDVIDTILQTVEATKKNMGVIMKQLPKEADRKVAAEYLREEMDALDKINKAKILAKAADQAKAEEQIKK